MARTNSREKDIFLAKINGKARELYVDDVKAAVKEKKYNIEDEVALLRKMVYALLTGDVTEELVAEFKAYNDAVEQSKKELKEEIGI